jgi:hypothetical protein
MAIDKPLDPLIQEGYIRSEAAACAEELDVSLESVYPSVIRVVLERLTHRISIQV